MGYRTNLSNDQVLIAYDLNFFLKKTMVKFYFSFNFIKEKPFLMLKQCLTEDFNFFLGHSS